MERKVTRAEERLNTYARRVKMSEEGKHWLMAAIDPFHDKPLSINGYPDGSPGKSIVQCFKLALDIAKPSNLAAGATWDCLINTDNFVSPVSMVQALMGVSVNSVEGRPSPTAVTYVGGCIVATGLSGSNLAEVPLVASTISKTALTVPNSMYEGKARVLAQGFEVCNTSNELYKNGSVTVFEVPQEVPEDKFTVSITSASGAALQGAMSVINTTQMPFNIAVATQIPGAKTWEAKDGVYTVCRQNGIFNPARRPSNVSPFMIRDDSTAFPTNPAVIYTKIGSPYGVVLGAAPTFQAPFHSKVAYFTNLSEQSTLHLNYNVWVERFPSPKESDLLSLATESCDYDVEALEAWSTISAQMPAGVKFAENGLGDWFTGEVASLIDSVTGTTFASGIDNWQKEKFSPKAVLPAQNVNVIDKRQRMNEKASKKMKAPKQGPMLPTGKFKANKKV